MRKSWTGPLPNKNVGPPNCFIHPASPPPLKKDWPTKKIFLTIKLKLFFVFALFFGSILEISTNILLYDIATKWVVHKKFTYICVNKKTPTIIHFFIFFYTIVFIVFCLNYVLTFNLIVLLKSELYNLHTGATDTTYHRVSTTLWKCGKPNSIPPLQLKWNSYVKKQMQNNIVCQ